MSDHERAPIKTATSEPSGRAASIMAHLVAGYPSYEQSLAVGGELAAAGVSFLEVQFPFSDPTADGPSIQAACTRALDEGFRTKDGFELVSSLSGAAGEPGGGGADTPPGAGPATAPPLVFIMTYASIACAHGVERFAERAAAAGAHGLIVPDLPPDYDEGLYAAGREAGLHVVPVLVPSASQKRIDTALATRPRYVYAALRKGTTGARTEIGAENIGFLEELRQAGVHVMAGFGIRQRDQVEALDGHAHTVVVGSAFVDTIAAGRSVGELARTLVYG